VTFTFDLESGVRVTCDVGYLCANFGLPMPLCSRFTPDVRDRQTSDKSIALVAGAYVFNKGAAVAQVKAMKLRPASLVRLPLIPISVTDGGRKGIWPILFSCSSRSPTLRALEQERQWR